MEEKDYFDGDVVCVNREEAASSKRERVVVQEREKNSRKVTT